MLEIIEHIVNVRGITIEIIGMYAVRVVNMLVMKVVIVGVNVVNYQDAKNPK